MERKISVPIYAGAFAISLVIFLAGVYIGSLIDQSTLGGISDDLSSISTKIASVHFMLLSGGNSSAFCPVYLSDLNSIDGEVERIGYKLSYLEDEKGVYDNELKKRYFVLEAESYLLSGKVRELCGDNSTLLIHFYSNTDCLRCREQGTEILKARDSLVQEGRNVKLFSFDGTIGSPVADAFKAQYNVSGYPSVVIDGKTYAGYRSSDELQTLIRAAE